MITVTGLTKHYGQRCAVDDLGFELTASRVTGFVGPNGAGKSTTMRMMVGLTRPDHGEVRYDGVRYVDLPHPARTVGSVLDARCMHPGRTARNHLRATAALSDIPVARVDEVLADPVFQSGDPRLRQQARAKTAPAVPSAQDPKPALAAPPDPDRDFVLGQFKQTVAETQLAESELLIPRLPATRREAQDIAALVPAAQRLTALDFAASRELVTSGRLADYQVVHFATHGLVNDRHPELSGLVLSLVDETGRQREGFLRMIDIFNLDLKADLVVLSACQTGIGKEIKGEGLMGLSRAFLYAGAKSTVVSLWSVNDRATAELMSRFYKHLFQQKQRPAAALRAAQLEMVEQTPWKSPYYWAAFTVNGDF